jgi:hypothetical protein
MSDLFKEKKEPVKKKTIIIKYPQLANPVKISIDIVDKRNMPINRTAILNKLGIKEVKSELIEQKEEVQLPPQPPQPEPQPPPPELQPPPQQQPPEPQPPEPRTKKPLQLKTVKKPQEIIPNPELDIIEPGKMKIINNYEEALEIGKKYISKATASKVFDFNKSNINTLNTPPQIANPIWQMTQQALTNTLDYLFKKLHHSFYMLCIMDNNSVIYKVEMTTPAPSFINAIETIHIPSLEKNTLITDIQKKYIKRELKKPARILQCIFKEQYKPISEETRYVEENLYANIVKNMKLPNGVFILNLTDAIILKANGREPFPMVTGDLPLNEFNFTEHIPILSMSGENNYLDIPIPNYDDIDSAKKTAHSQFNTIWSDKQNKAIFRGGPSGCGYTAETNQRLKLITFKNDLLDVGLTSQNKTIDSKSIKFDPINGIGMLNTNIKSAKFATMQEQSNYKYIIHVDGNVNAYRLLTTMRTGSLILRVKSEYTSWVDHLIKPNVHYILINSDLSNLEERLQWCIQNDKKCEGVAKSSLSFSTTMLDETIIKKYFQKILWSLSKYDSNASAKVIPQPTQPLKSVRIDAPPEQTPEQTQIELVTQKANVEQLTARLPTTKAINIRSSQYYLNNREYFINFINRLLEPYKRQLQANLDEYKCDKSGDDSFSLLTHQMIVRDYINLITPYRGLLLYHGLGSGKTCSSIAIVEGIKTDKQVMIMLPKSLEENYKQELKKCGDILYRNNQYWEFISIKTNPKLKDALASVLSLSPKIIEKNSGAWFIDKNKSSNYTTLTISEQKSLNEQIDSMLNNKYVFVRYNGLREKKFDEMVAIAKGNPFSNKVIVIDEAHNFVSRIVNQIKRPASLAMKIYNYLQSAENTKIILLTGTPIINYPHEVAIMMNILRGNINTWQLKLINEGKFKLTENSLAKLFASKLESNIDYLRFKATPEPVLTITRNPYGFFSVIDKNKNYSGVELNEGGNISDSDFIAVVRQILLEENIKTEESLISFKANKCLPDNKDEFNKYFLETSKKGDPITLKNMDLFKRRILGLVSYFPDIDALLPKFNKNDDFHIILVPMSKFQFDEYEKARAEERKLERNNAKKNALKGAGDLFESSSTYRIFSRAFCNFVFPAPDIVRPLPRDSKSIGDVINDDTNEDLVDAILIPNDIEQQEVQEGQEGPDGQEGPEGQLIKSEITSYASRIIKALATLDKRRDEFLTPEKLTTYSPKFLNILNRLLDDTYEGTHLIYSQFRTLEGIGILSLVLKANGFAQFKIVKSQGEWRLNIKEEDIAKPKFILYTGTEQPEEKEILRNIFNSNWDALDATITKALKEDIIKLNGGEIGDKNIYGAVIKIIMITASGAEGISLSNVRYVHITEPYWHPVRNDQVIGRARRICSHKSLPSEKQTVEVFLYLMDLTKELVDTASKELKKQDRSALDKSIYMRYKTTDDPYLTSDQSLYEISKQKENVTQEILKNMKESSIDCNLHNAVGSSSELKCLSFGSTNTNKYIYTPAIETDDKDDAKKLNKQSKKIEIKPILITNKDGSKIECGYNILDLIQSNEDANKVVETTLYTLDSIKLKNPVIIGTISFKNTAAADEAPNYEKYQINIK